MKRNCWKTEVVFIEKNPDSVGLTFPRCRAGRRGGADGGHGDRGCPGGGGGGGGGGVHTPGMKRNGRHRCYGFYGNGLC